MVYSGLVDKKAATVFEPQFKANGTIIFIHGAYTDWRIYEGFLQRLAETYRIIAYSMRGHGAAKRRVYSNSLALRELIDIVEKCFPKEEKIGALGHSLGGWLACKAAEKVNLKGVYLINPYFGRGFLPAVLRPGLNLVSALSRFPYVLKTVDSKLKGYFEKLGCKTSRPLQVTAELSKIRPEKFNYRGAAGFMISGRDEIYCTKNPKRWKRLRKACANAFENSKDHSRMARFLNHCLNLRKGELVPFCKEEEGKPLEAILEKIVVFYSKAFSRN